MRFSIAEWFEVIKQLFAQLLCTPKGSFTIRDFTISRDLKEAAKTGLVKELCYDTI